METALQRASLYLCDTPWINVYTVDPLLPSASAEQLTIQANEGNRRFLIYYQCHKYIASFSSTIPEYMRFVLSFTEIFNLTSFVSLRGFCDTNQYLIVRSSSPEQTSYITVCSTRLTNCLKLSTHVKRSEKSITTLI